MSLILREPTILDAELLSQLLCEDSELRADLEFQQDELTTSAAFFAQISEWCERTQSTTYAIVLNEQAIGIISLSHKNNHSSSARVGLWIGSAHRKKGIAMTAALLISKEAVKLGINNISFAISDKNIAAKGLANKCGAKAQESDDSGKTTYSVDLMANNQRHAEL